MIWALHKWYDGLESIHQYLFVFALVVGLNIAICYPPLIIPGVSLVTLVTVWRIAWIAGWWGAREHWRDAE